LIAYHLLHLGEFLKSNLLFRYQNEVEELSRSLLHQHFVRQVLNAKCPSLGPLLGHVRDHCWLLRRHRSGSSYFLFPWVSFGNWLFISFLVFYSFGFWFFPRYGCKYVNTDGILRLDLVGFFSTISRSLALLLPTRSWGFAGSFFCLVDLTLFFTIFCCPAGFKSWLYGILTWQDLFR
jgi:hypothetical protein